MATAFKILLGLSPVLAIVLFFVLSQQHSQDSEVAVAKEQLALETAQFNESFEQSEVELSDSNSSVAYHSVKRDEYKAEAEVITSKRKEAVKKRSELQEKTEKEFSEMEKSLDSFNDKESEDFDF